MGRELKRVPLDFKWPIDQLWKGFINPYRSQECKPCNGEGYNPETKKINEEWYASDNPRWVDINENRRFNDNAHQYHITDVEVLALVKSGRLPDLMDGRYLFNKETKKWEKFINGAFTECEIPNIPTAESVNEWNKKSMGHDSCNRWIAVEARAKDLGVYGLCEFCKGDGQIYQSEEIEKLHDEWKSFDPPTGNGFQLWSTTTEGHPMTPVFSTLDELCQHLQDNKVSVFGYSTATKEEWMKMLDDGHVYHQEGNAIFI